MQRGLGRRQGADRVPRREDGESKVLPSPLEGERNVGDGLGWEGRPVESRSFFWFRVRRRVRGKGRGSNPLQGSRVPGIGPVWVGDGVDD